MGRHQAAIGHPTGRAAATAWALVAVLGYGAAEAGDIVGVVKFLGVAPPPDLLYVEKDQEVCGTEPRPSEALVVAPHGGVKNAVVFLAHERVEGWRAPANTVFELEQQHCTFIPRVLAIPPGATVEVRNSDGILHNFHTRSRANPPLNLAQPGFRRVLRVTFEKPEFVAVKCDLHGHGLMRAWIVVARNPHYAISDEEGQFRLPNVPAGPHTLEVWHEVLGVRRVSVTVSEAGESPATITFAPRN